MAETNYVALEYSEACSFLRNYANLRRQGLMFVTVVQGALLTILSNNECHYSILNLFLSILLVLVAFVGIYNEKRLNGRRQSCYERLKDIEGNDSGMALITSLHRKSRIGNYTAFCLFYAILASGSVVIWIYWKMGWALVNPANN